eukprot:g26098.t1
MPRVHQDWTVLRILCVACVVDAQLSTGITGMESDLSSTDKEGKCFLNYREDKPDCRSTGRCCNKGMKCFEKNSQWSACMPSCTSGVQYFLEPIWDWQSWSCKWLKPLDLRYHYDRFPNKEMEVGALIINDDVLRTTAHSAERCREMCSDDDRRENSWRCSPPNCCCGPLELLLTTLRELFGDREESRIREPPSLLFIEADQLLQRGALQRTSHTLRSVRPLLSDLAVSGVMLSDDGKEVPHWMLPSVLAPVLDAKNKMNIELPCWTIGCTSGLTGGGLALVMIVKSLGRFSGEILREVSKQQNFPLELYEEPFVDFATTRNRALQLAGQSSEFVLMLSGDETLVHGAQLRRFVTQHSGYCGGSEDVKAVEALNQFTGDASFYPPLRKKGRSERSVTLHRLMVSPENSIEDLLRIVSENRPFDTDNLATAIHKLAKLRRNQNVPYEVITEDCPGASGLFLRRWAMRCYEGRYTLLRFAAAVKAAIHVFVHERLPKFRIKNPRHRHETPRNKSPQTPRAAQDLSSLAWAVATARAKDAAAAALLRQVSIESTKTVQSFGPQDLAMCAWAFAKDRSDGGAWHGLAQQEFSNVVWSFASLLRTSEMLFRRTAVRVVGMAAQLDSQHLANIAWAYDARGQK